MTTYFSTQQICAATGATFRQVDHWTRQGVLQPAEAGNGSGRPRRFTPEQAPIVRCLAILSRLGAPLPVMALVAERLTAAPLLLHHRVVVDPKGRVWLAEGVWHPDGWVIDLPTHSETVGLELASTG